LAADRAASHIAPDQPLSRQSRRRALRGSSDAEAVRRRHADFFTPWPKQRQRSG
jgi:hypothetical protein